MISVWPKFYSFDPEMVLHFHFTFKPFPGHTQKRESERKREREKERRESRDRPKPSSPISSADITSTAPIARSADRDRVKCPDLMIFFFWVLFVFWEMNDIIYSFGNREDVRKCEQQVENVFSMVLSRTQPNIRKYFSKHFLKCNQTHENIFFSGK